MLATMDLQARSLGYAGGEVVEVLARRLPLKDTRFRCVPRNTILFWQDEHLPHAMEVVEGTVRAVRLWSDGSRQILAFFWPGTTIWGANLQRYTAEAVTRCVLRPREEIVASDLSGTDQVLQASIRLLAATGKKSAISRIAWFLLEIKNHLPEDPSCPNALRFTIPRNDVADHLGMTLETTCRTLATLREQGLIDLPTRKTIRYRNIAKLAKLASLDRECAAFA